jgi:hypothetical protein
MKVDYWNPKDDESKPPAKVELTGNEFKVKTQGERK